MPHEGSLLQASVIFLLAAVITVPLAKRLQLGAVLGYLLAGVVIGPQVLRLVDDPESVAHFSEMGVVLLLFIIGLELSPRRLWLMRKAVFGVGLAQVIVTGIAIGALAITFFGQSVAAAVILGLGLALSSTALGLQSLAESRQLNSPHGRLAFAVLLFQDIAAIPLIALVPLLATHGVSNGGESPLMSGLKVLGSIAVVVIGGRYLLRPVFRIVAKTGLPEVSTATALLIVLADSEYRHELESQIEPFKGLLLGLFFISVGMGANLSLLLEVPALIIGLTLLLIAIKLPLLMIIGRMAGGLDAISALRLGTVLAAGGEFAFVVFKLAQANGLFDTRTYDILLMTITLSMAVTPLLQLAITKWLKAQPQPAKPVPESFKAIESEGPRVVIAGMGRVGQIVARILHAQNIPYVALDTSVDTIEMTRTFEHVPVFYGAPTRPEILSAAKVGNAHYFIVALDDVEKAVSTAEVVQRLYPHVKVIARARNRQHLHQLLDAGATPVRETLYSSLEMTRRTLEGLGLTASQADYRIRQFIAHDEQVLAAQHAVREDRAKVMQTAQEARLELARLFKEDSIDSSISERS
jgi:glutathione-regulated potassium-efflux system protein KefB